MKKLFIKYLEQLGGSNTVDFTPLGEALIRLKSVFPLNTLGDKGLDELIPLEVMFLYAASNMGEFTVDKTNRTITMNSSYTIDSDTLDSWQTTLANAKNEYESEYSVDNELASNDYVLFDKLENWLSVSKQLFE